MHGLIPKLKARMTKRIVVVVRIFRDLEAQKIDSIFELACGLVYGLLVEKSTPYLPGTQEILHR